MPFIVITPPEGRLKPGVVRSSGRVPTVSGKGRGFRSRTSDSKSPSGPVVNSHEWNTGS